eukprot:2365479-Pyramimonas_sp.AAC.1
MHEDNLKSSYAHTVCVAGPKTSPSSHELKMMSPLIVRIETHTHTHTTRPNRFRGGKRQLRKYSSLRREAEAVTYLQQASLRRQRRGEA